MQQSTEKSFNLKQDIGTDTPIPLCPPSIEDYTVHSGTLYP